MEIHIYPEVELHISRDIREDFSILSADDLERRVNDNLDLFINRNPEHSEYIQRFSKYSGLTGTIMLDAHGCKVKGKFVYCDEDQLYLVQNWINAHDGRGAVLLVTCCNPLSLEVHSRRSIVLVPNFIFSEARQEEGETIVEMYVPGKGYIDSYTIDYELEQLKPATNIY